MKKKVTVAMTLSWTFDEKEWSEQKEHIENLKDNPRIVLGYDIHNAWHNLNDMTHPDLTDIEVKNADE
tara:strand:- start:123 stop:326 length:204 start_codon:yes stop_codon:yes gene_type:complete